MLGGVLRGILGREMGGYMELSCGRVIILNMHSFMHYFLCSVLEANVCNAILF